MRLCVLLLCEEHDTTFTQRGKELGNYYSGFVFKKENLAKVKESSLIYQLHTVFLGVEIGRKFADSQIL